MRALTISLCAVAAWALAGCSTVERSLIFFTNTTTGLEVSAGASSTDPVRIIVGYKRQEGVLNPVYDPQGLQIIDRGSTTTTSGGGTSTPPTTVATGEHVVEKYRSDAYSVLAKYAGGASGDASGASASATNAQWFATGKAADILAAQPGIAGAVTGSSDVAQAAADQAKALSITDATREANFAMLLAVDDGLAALANDGDSTAASLRNRLADLDRDPYRPSFDDYSYSYNPASATLTRTAHPATAEDELANRFRRITSRWDAINLSVQSLTDALQSGTSLSEPGVTRDAAQTAAWRTDLQKRLKDLTDLRVAFEDSLSKEPVVLEAVTYFIKRLRKQ